MSSGIVITDDDMEKIPHHHKEIFKTLIANMNKTFHETLNQTRGRNPEQSQELDSWTSSQVLIKVKKILKGTLDLIPSPSLLEKFKLWAGKFA